MPTASARHLPQTRTATARRDPIGHRLAPRRRAPGRPATTTWSPHRPVLTDTGRELLRERAERLRQLTVPVLRAAVDRTNCDGHTDAAYARARDELHQVTAALTVAALLPATKTVPDQAELGDLVTVEIIDAPPRGCPSPAPAGPAVQRFVLVHPAEAGLDHQRLSVASPLGSAIFGRRVGSVVTVDAPGGRYRVHLRAAGRPAAARGGAGR